MHQKTDRDGRLAISGVNDSQLTQVSYDQKRRELSLFLEAKGVSTRILASDVQVLNIGGLWEGCVATDLFIWLDYQVPEPFLFDPHAGWAHLFAGRIDDRDEILREVERHRVHLPKSALLSLTCSYGGGVSALCGDVRVMQSPPARGRSLLPGSL